MSDEQRRDIEIGKLSADVDQIKDQMQCIDLKLDKALQQLSMYKNFIMLLKFTGYAAVAILSFKLGDVAEIWRSTMGPPSP